MMVTLITDASYAIRDKNNAAGWAGYAVSERGRKYYGDQMKVPPVNNTNAEMFAVVNTLHMALQDRIAIAGDYILIQVDCLPAVNQFLNAYPQEKLDSPCKKQAHRLQATACRDAFFALVNDNQLTFDFRYIKAHCGTEDPKYFVHNQVDRTAKRHMATQSAAMKRGNYGS